MCAFCGMLYSNVTHGRGKRGGVGGGGGEGGCFCFFHVVYHCVKRWYYYHNHCF